MKKVYLFLLLCVAGTAAYAQTAASYLFSRSSGTFTSISGDVGATPISSGGMISDDGTTFGIPIGFTFYFSGAPYTTLAANANGWVSLSGVVPTAGSDSIFTPDPANIVGPGFLMPFWDDLFGTGATAYYETSGTPGSRVFTIEYNNWSKCCSSDSGSFYFQVKLYEGTGMVQFVYGSSVGAPSDAAIGIGNSSTDFQSLPTTTSTTTDSTTFFTSDSLPASGTVLQWCPVGTITGSASVCMGATTSLSSVYTGGTWSSSDTTIATVDSTGLVTSVAVGNANITYTPVCGTPGVVQVSVNPIPDVATVSSQSICITASLTAPSAPVSFSGTYTATTTFSWADNNPAIGIGVSSGTGDIGSFTATDTGITPVSSVFTVTPSRLGCVGTAQTFTITVNPYPTVNPSVNQTLCNGAMTTAVIFTGSVPGTSFNWVNTNSSIGLAASGTTDTINAFTITDTSSSSAVSAVITVNTTANGCTGGSNSFTFIANPTPVLTSSLTAPAICNGTLFNYIPTASTGAGTTFTWSRAAVSGISNSAASGTDNPEEILNDTTAYSDTVTYVYALMTSAGCTDTQNVTVVVNPTPMLNVTTTPPAICDSTMFMYVSSSATSDVKYTWSRAAVAGISNPAASGTGDIMEYLNDTTLGPVTVAYVDTLTDTLTGCMNTQTVTVTVNAKPTLNTPLTMAAICDSGTIMYVPGSDIVGGATFTWSRVAIGGNPAANGGDTISEMLVNTGDNPILVQYVDTITSIASGCQNTEIITVSVNPTPMLSSTLTPAGICDSALFNYVPMSNTVGAQFMWNRPFVLGIGLPSRSDSGTVFEYLKNNTNDNLNVVYVYTVSINGCSHMQDVTVVVHPTPTISSATTWTVCSGAPVNYVPTGYVFGTTFKWSRSHVAGITPATANDSFAIGESLTDSALIPLTAVYVYTLTANGCSHVEDVSVIVDPVPASLMITTHPPASLCDNTMFQNFGVAAVPPANEHYHWTATNATVYATGADGQYALVNFDHPGTAVITMNSNVTGFGCTTSNSYVVNVGSSMSDNPPVTYFQGQFLCLQPDEDSYQWGFDDHLTLDSTLIAGENNPNYINMSPDFTNRHYWVITTKGDCMQKTYYNAPTGVTNINTETASLNVYPNPASSVLNVEINTTLNGNFTLDIVNMLGQKMTNAVAENHRARIDVSAIPVGCYLVDCYRDGVKVATVRFVKN